MLTHRFIEALQVAASLHEKQIRKGSDTPYVAHLLAVTALVLENGGDEDQAIAALLHDAVEDQGGLETLEEIRRRFGEHVAYLVDGCTDAYQIPKPPWRERKEAYLERLKQAAPDVRLVSLADKVHNSRSLLSALRRNGESTWKHFKGGKAGTLWYYQELIAEFRDSSQPDTDELVLELAETIKEIQNLAGT